MTAIAKAALTMVAAVGLIGSGALAYQSRTFDVRPGYAVSQQYYQSIELPTTSPISACEARCATDRRCDAYTWRMSMGNTTGLCYLYAGSITPVAAPTVTLGIAPDRLTAAQREASRLRSQRSPEEVVDLYAPRIRERRLTSGEREQVQSLLASAMSRNDLDWSQMEPLMTLAESGDRDAMRAVLTAFKGPEQHVVYRGVWYAPWESFAGMPTAALAGRWAGEYWNRHGADPLAASLLAQCFADAVMPCGLTLPVMNPRQRTAFLDYGRGLSGRAPRLDLAFAPAYRGEAELRARYDALVERRTAFDPLSAVRAGTHRRLLPAEEAWANAYAAARPDVADIQRASIEQEAARVAAEDNLPRVNVALARDRAQAAWNDLWGRSGLSDVEQGNLEAAASVLGDDYVMRLANVQPLRFDNHITMVCAAQHPSCEPNRRAATEREALLQAEIRQTAANADARQAAIAAAMASGSGLVEVRRYDRAGNYIGTSTMTQSQAETVGARPQ